MTTFCINRDENSTNYNFSIVPDGALSESMTIRWEIVPIGALPITLSAPLSGEVIFATTDTTKTIIPTIPTSNTHAFPRDFEIRLYKVVEHAEDELLLTQAERLGGDANLVGDREVSRDGNGSVSIIGLGETRDVTADGGALNDHYIITRFQYGDVSIEDTVGDANIIKFDYGVSIIGYEEEALVLPSLTIYSNTKLTLSTGAVVTINAPNGNFLYQLGDDAPLDYNGFKVAIGASGNGNASALAEEYTIDSFTTAPVLSNPRTENNFSHYVIGGGNEDILSAASDYNLNMSGGSGNDILVITRFQYGDVSIDDSDALVKFDYAVTITDYEESSSVFRGNKRTSVMDLTLSTGAEITITSPNRPGYGYQLGDGELLTYDTFKKAIGASGTNETSDLAEDYKIIYNAPPEFTQKSFTFDVTDNAATADAPIGQVSATDVDDANALTYSIKSGNSAGLFAIDANDGKITFTASPTQTTPTTHNLVVKVRDSAGNTDTATISIIDSAIRGTDGVNTLTGTSSADVIYGYGERDTLDGAGGDDVIYGGAGNDVLRGGTGAGADTLNGDAGNDTLYGGAGHDTLSGGAEVDILYGGGGNDVFAFDIASAATSNADIVADFARGGGDGIDTIRIAGASREELRVDTTFEAVITDLRTGENNADVDDTVIYYTKGAEEIVLVVLEDFIGFNLDTMVEIV